MNRKSVSERAKIIELLVEGNSVRGTSRIAGVSTNTVLKLLRDVGTACDVYQDRTFRNLPCQRIEVDELHSYVGCREKNVKPDSKKPEGVYWIWTSICSDSKLIPSWYVGPRDAFGAEEFISDLAPRMKNRIQITSDGLAKYPNAIEKYFGSDVDYAVLQKQYDKPKNYRGPKRYTGCLKERKIGDPNPALISTSFVERSNLTLRMGCKRFARKTNAFSRKLEYHCHALALHFAYYNLVRIHNTLRVTPAMALGIETKLWSLEDLIRLAEEPIIYPDPIIPPPMITNQIKPMSAAQFRDDRRGRGSHGNQYT